MASRSSNSVFFKTGGRKNVYTFKMMGITMAITVTNDAEVVSEWISFIETLGKGQYLGFEIEFDVSTAQIGTLQLCAFMQLQCLIFQPQKPALPPSLVQFLVGGTHKFVSLDGHSKIQLLRAEFPFEGEVEAVPLDEDTPFATNLIQRELDTIALEETDWDRFPSTLSDEQVHYACAHAFLNLYIRLSKSP